MFNEDQMLSWPIVAIVTLISLGSFGLPIVLSWNSGQLHPKMFLVLIGPAVIVLLMLCLRLKTTVDDISITTRLFPFTRSETEITDIQQVEIVEYNPMSDFGGWGIRYGLGGTIYSIQGNTAVKLSLASGKTIYIGTQRSTDLFNAVSSRLR